MTIGGVKKRDGEVIWKKSGEGCKRKKETKERKTGD
jgi:hypothetical protein